MAKIKNTERMAYVVGHDRMSHGAQMLSFDNLETAEQYQAYLHAHHNPGAKIYQGLNHTDVPLHSELPLFARS